MASSTENYTKLQAIYRAKAAQDRAAVTQRCVPCLPACLPACLCACVLVGWLQSLSPSPPRTLSYLNTHTHTHTHTLTLIKHTYLA